MFVCLLACVIFFQNIKWTNSWWDNWGRKPNTGKFDEKKDNSWTHVSLMDMLKTSILSGKTPHHDTKTALVKEWPEAQMSKINFKSIKNNDNNTKSIYINNKSIYCERKPAFLLSEKRGTHKYIESLLKKCNNIKLMYK